MNNLIVSILAGGSGQRLWPLSTEEYPKQFSINLNGKSLFSNIVDFALSLNPKKIIVITNEKYRFIVQNELGKITNRKISIFLEPVQKNTSAAVHISAMEAKKSKIDYLLTLPCDQYYYNFNKFKIVIKKAIEKKCNATLFGYKPKEFDGNFGYIEYKNNIIEKFIEKPKKKPPNFSNFYINMGIFLFNNNYFLESQSMMNNIYSKKIEKIYYSSTTDIGFIRFNENLFKKLENISIDYLFFEKIKIKEINFEEISFHWNDVGSYYRFFDEYDAESNKTKSKDNILLINSKNNFITSDVENRKIIGMNISDTLFIEKNNNIFITKKTNAPQFLDYKKLIEQKGFVNEPNIDLRPWGSFRILYKSDLFKIKLLKINPKKSISLQKHKYRSEHWIVIDGEALVKKNNKNYILKKNESTFIKKNDIHKITNNKNKILSIIEIQTGNYFGEDDIKRYD